LIARSRREKQRLHSEAGSDVLKFDYSPVHAAGIEILAFRSSATSSRQIKSFHDFIPIEPPRRKEREEILF
jgi:hypothetical protein